MARPHQFIIPSVIVLLLELTIHVFAEIERPTRLALPSDFNTITDYTGQIRSFSEFGGGPCTDPPALICYSDGEHFQVHFTGPPEMPSIPINQEFDCSRIAPPNQLAISTWFPNPVTNGDAIVLRRGQNYSAPDGEYCCRSNGDSSITRCLTLTSCPALTPVTNGRITYNRITNQATYACNPGYVQVGTSSITCNEGTPGNWSAAQPTCQPVDCGSPPAIPNGSVSSPSRTTFGQTATYSCTTGYGLLGSASVQCLASGVWGTSPSCQAMCGLPPGISNGSPGIPTSTIQGGMVTYSCNTGYQLSGSATVTCQDDRNWSTRPSCLCKLIDMTTESTCGALCPRHSLTNGMVSYSTTEDPPPVGTVVTYSCDTGYELSGVIITTCMPGTGWSGALPVCNVVDCGSLANPTNGVVATSSGTFFMSTATYSCNTGYVIAGLPTRICGANGNWTQLAPTCHAVDCGTPTVDNGLVSTPSGTIYLNTATYSCDNGYTLNGTNLSTCAAHAQWSPSPPTCDPVDCGPLTNPLNGVVDTSSSTTFMSVATYSCAERYILSGFVSRECQADRTWSLEAPVCTLISLSAGPISFNINNSAVAISLIGEGSSALTCQTELSSCCRDTDNPSGEALGEWVGPDGRAIQENSDGGFYITRHSGAIRLNRGRAEITIGGSYCCVLPRAGGVTLTTCVLVEALDIPNPCVTHSIAFGVILSVAVAVIVVQTTCLIIRTKQYKNASAQPSRVDSHTDNVIYAEPTLTHFKKVDRKPGVGMVGPSAIELSQCSAYQASSN